MVLLTSSAISVAISSGVVCIFTFLLFLSGYVLQQQTVRSLQEALRQPPSPPPSIPSAVVRNHESDFDLIFPGKSNQAVVKGSQVAEQDNDSNSEKTDVVTTRIDDGVLSNVADYLAGGQVDSPLPSSIERLAYVLSVPHPSTLCSALLFTKTQREQSHLLNRPSIIYLYPSTWETSKSPSEAAALKLMRDMQDKYDLIYHPVEISSVWIGVGVEAQLLGELQRTRWDYDRVMYLRSPGLALDMIKLDGALRFSNLKKSWTPISSSTGQEPEMMLIPRGQRLMVPRGNLRQLTASAVTSHANHHEGEMDVEILAKDAAYVIFNEAELDHRKQEKEWFGGLFERFERERRGMCEGTTILNGHEDDHDLR